MFVHLLHYICCHGRTFFGGGVFIGVEKGCQGIRQVFMFRPVEHNTFFCNYKFSINVYKVALVSILFFHVFFLVLSFFSNILCKGTVNRHGITSYLLGPCKLIPQRINAMEIFFAGKTIVSR